MKDKILYFVVGSQHLYGEETLKQVAEHAQEMARFLDSQEDNPVTIKYLDTVKTPQEVTDMCQKVNFDPQCVGIIAWMHTFSPAKMWINGLKILNKPMLHLHTQYNEKIPYDSIDMDFMNLNQAAHGDREFGHIVTRLRIRRKIVVGYYKDPDVLKQIFVFARAAAAAAKSKTLKVARFGDNMREVAVTEGDKVEAQVRLGWSINGYGLGDLVEYIDRVSQKEIDGLVETYKEKYVFQKDIDLEAVKTQAKYQIALERFLQDGGFDAFTTTFENLHGLKQLPGLACQVLMEKGYGFGAEGDWKTAALTHLVKYMAAGLEGGSSFMED